MTANHARHGLWKKEFAMNSLGKETWTGSQSFRMVRYFSIANLICILITAGLLVTIFRKVTIDTMVKLGERGNQTLALATLDSIRPQVLDYFVSQEGQRGIQDNPREADEKLRHALKNQMRNHSMVRIKLIGQEGKVLFSTQLSQIGLDQSRNPGFAAAMEGKVVSELIYRDTFNYFDQVTENDNLIQSYVPVRGDQDSPILGVFEVYTDVDPLVKRIEKASVLVAVGVGLVLTLLYSLLAAIVRRANRIIERQQALIQDRTKTLEILSAQMLTAQEDEKKRIAGDLHEGIAQTLSAVMNHVEAACRNLEKHHPTAETQSLRGLLPPIRSAIKEISTFAMNLRPASLDDFGLIPTLAWWIEEFQQNYPGLQIDTEIEIEEQVIPAPLKVVIYRVIQDTLTALAKEGRADQVRLSLEKRPREVSLSIEDNGLAYHPAETGAAASPREVGLAMIKERTVLSGGSFSLDSNHQGGTIRQAAWAC